MKKLISIFKNKYVAAVLIFLFVMLFFNSNNIISQYEYAKKLHKLKQDKKYYIEQIAKDKKTLQDMKNPKILEKMGREEYLMKKDNEDIFLIIVDSTKKQ
ncbi:MAG: septum formation initiator family protein [Bacteroidota bacterium]|nr:septum formation initiator family protein [Bacteroidota bacterium]